MHRLVPVLAALAGAVLLLPGLARAGSTGIVVSQVFAGGGNAGAPYANDYVELFNRGATVVDVGGWTVQYATAGGTSWSATPIAGTIPPGGHYLVGLASGGTNGAALPAPDASGTTNAAASGGKIALVRDAAALACGATAGSCSANALVEDLVGYGAASDYEGSAAAAAPGSTAALLRAGDGCADTDDNAADLSTGTPAPRNSAAPPHACSVTPPPPGAGVSADAAVDVEIEPLISIALERAALSFGKTVAGTTPAAISEQVTVRSTNVAGYTLNVGRSAFSPADLPLALRAAAPAPGGVLGSALGGGGLVGIPIGTATLDVGTMPGPSAAAGDVWPTFVGFAGALPVVPPGRYTASLTFTVIGR